MKKILLFLFIVMFFTGCTGTSVSVSSIKSDISSKEVSSLSDEEKNDEYNRLLLEKDLRVINGYDLYSIKGFIDDSPESPKDFINASPLEIADAYCIGGINFFTDPEKAESTYTEGYTNEQRTALLNRGLTKDKILVLMRMDYSYNQILNISEDELNFIFPNNLLREKLASIGIKNERFYSLSYRECVLLALSQPSWNDFKVAAMEKGIWQWEIDALLDYGFVYNEILKMTDEQRNWVLAPGTFSGLSFDKLSLDNIVPGTIQKDDNLFYSSGITETDYAKLEKEGINKDMVTILCNIGYVKDEIYNLSEEEKIFIFPITELRTKLNNCGYPNEAITCSEQWLKHLIREAITYQSNLTEWEDKLGETICD